MKFYSEHTKKFYDSPEACVEAENALLAAEEEKKHAKQNHLNELAALKANYDESSRIATEANKASKEAYNTLANAVHAFYSKHGYVPQEYQNLNFLLQVFTSKF